MPGENQAASAGAAFDAYAGDYEEALKRGIGLSGEESSYFARGRVQWVRRRLCELGMQTPAVLDFGCGTGSTTPFLLELPGAAHVVGTDVSSGLLEVARDAQGSDRIEFVPTREPLVASTDLAYCNGVFHHIPVAERGDAVSYVLRSLRPGGLFALWENNPWNPGTRLVMRRIPFDRDAVTLSPPRARQMLAAGGFEIVRTDFLFVFPSPLAALRRLEPAIARLPLGAQYMVLARKPWVR